MKVKASELIALAETQIGYCEKASNKDLDDYTANAGDKNYTKYSRDLYKAGFYNGSKQGMSWCAVFVDWCFYVASDSEKDLSGMKPTSLLGASCKYTKNYYAKLKRLDKTPKLGDQVFFIKDGAICHTGLVSKVTKDKITVIEGNCGNCVKQRSYRLSDPYIDSFGHPSYLPEEEPMPSLKVGDTIRLNSDATVYGKDMRFSSWVYATPMYVRSIKGDKCTFSIYKTGDITGSTSVYSVNKVL